MRKLRHPPLPLVESKRPKTLSPHAASPVAATPPAAPPPTASLAAAELLPPPPPCDEAFASPQEGDGSPDADAEGCAAAGGARRPDWCAASSGGSIGWAAGAGIDISAGGGRGSPCTPPDASAQVRFSRACGFLLRGADQRRSHPVTEEGNRSRSYLVPQDCSRDTVPCMPRALQVLDFADGRAQLMGSC